MATFDPTAPEQWYPLPDFPAYEISSHLRARTNHGGPRQCMRHRPPRIIKVFDDDRGYKKLILWKDKKYHNIYLHHIVALLVYGPCPEGQIVRHLDDDKSNNWPANLRYGTQTENAEDCKRNGHFVTLRGEERSNATFSDREVRAIKRLHEYGVSASIIAKCFDREPKRLYPILTGQRWCHINTEMETE